MNKHTRKRGRPSQEHTVIVGNVGVFHKPSKGEALKDYKEWVSLSKEGIGRVAGEPVALMDSYGEIVKEYIPKDYEN